MGIVYLCVFNLPFIFFSDMPNLSTQDVMKKTDDVEEKYKSLVEYAYNNKVKLSSLIISHVCVLTMSPCRCKLFFMVGILESCCFQRFEIVPTR